MTAEIIFITGANSGIGYEAVKALLASPSPYHILLGSRSPEKGAAAAETLRKENPTASNTVETIQIDITDDDSIEQAVKTIEEKHGRIDALVNNAGGSHDKPMGSTGRALRQELNTTYDLNLTGTHVLTHAAAPLLLKSGKPRLLFVTSGTSSLATSSVKFLPPTDWPAGWPKPAAPAVIGYKASKAALNLVMTNWAAILRADGVRTWCLSPGFLATNLMMGDPDLLRKMGAGEPSIGGEFIRDVVEGKRDADAGKVINPGGIQPW